MTDEIDMQELLDAIAAEVRAEWQGQPPVEAVHFEIGPDHTDDPAVFAVVVLPDDTDEGIWDSEHLDPIENLIKKKIRDRKLNRWVYVRFMSPADLKVDPLEEGG